MRITQNLSADNSIYNLQQGRAQLDKLQTLTATGQNVSQPSDDPIATRLLLDIGDKIKAADQHSSNISKATSWMQFTSTALDGMSQILTQAETTVGNINTGSNDPSVRQSAHDQLVELKKQIVDMGNTQYGDQYIFGGANNTTPPFSTANNTYSGDGTQISIEIAQNATEAMNITGDRLLKGTGSNPSYGSVDILGTFDKLIAAVGDSTTPSSQTDITQAAKDLYTGSTQLLNATTDVLSRQTRLDNMSKLNDNTKNTLLNITSNVQDVDYAKLGVELSQQQNAFQASLSATAKYSQMSLLNYM